MKNIGVFISENFQFLEVKFSIYLNRHVFVMKCLGIRLSGTSSDFLIDQNKLLPDLLYNSLQYLIACL